MASQKIAAAAEQAAEDLRAAAVADGFATIREAELYLGLSRAKIYDLMESAQLKYAKFGRSRRIPWAALREFAAGCLVGA